MPTIREATPADAEPARRIVREAFAPYVPRLCIEPWPMTLDYASVIEAGHTWVAESDGGDLDGVLVLEPHRDHLLLDVIAVSPASQGSGVGNALMAHAETVARERGLGEVRLYTNVAMTENLAYYPRRGYVETHRDKVHGFHRVFFMKVL